MKRLTNIPFGLFKDQTIYFNLLGIRSSIRWSFRDEMLIYSTNYINISWIWAKLSLLLKNFYIPHFWFIENYTFLNFIHYKHNKVILLFWKECAYCIDKSYFYWQKINDSLKGQIQVCNINEVPMLFSS